MKKNVVFGINEIAEKLLIYIFLSFIKLNDSERMEENYRNIDKYVYIFILVFQ